MAESLGALTEAVYYILLSLFEPMHGYGIMQNVKALSHGRVSMGAGTLYGAINTLVEKGWIQPCQTAADERKKEYIITRTGKAMVIAEISRLEELIKNGKQVTGGISI
jgi:DNA-binding PadR family transcriptional regulator